MIILGIILLTVAAITVWSKVTYIASFESDDLFSTIALTVANGMSSVMFIALICMLGDML